MRVLPRKGRYRRRAARAEFDMLPVECRYISSLDLLKRASLLLMLPVQRDVILSASQKGSGGHTWFCCIVGESNTYCMAMLLLSLVDCFCFLPPPLSLRAHKRSKVRDLNAKESQTVRLFYNTDSASMICRPQAVNYNRAVVVVPDGQVRCFARQSDGPTGLHITSTSE